MRVGIIAAAAGDGTSGPVVGERDALLVSERLAMGDMGFKVHTVDPARDMAAQVDLALASYGGGVDEVLLYVSARAVTLEDGECFFCLDLANPDVGDAVRDVVMALAERSSGRALMVVEARHDGATVDELRDAAKALRAAIDPPSTGIEAIVSVRAIDAHPERIPSRFTAGFLEEIDGRVGPLVAKQVYAAVVQHADLGAWPHAEIYASGTQSVSLRDPSRYPVPSSHGSSPRGPVSSDRSGKAASDASAKAEPPPPPVRAPKAPPEEPPPPAVRAPKVAPPSADSPVFIPPPVPVPAALLAGAADAAQDASAESSQRGSAGKRPAPPSERADAATVTLTTRRGPKPVVDAALPKVVIDARVDPRKRPTIRNVDVKAVLAEAGITPRQASDANDSRPGPVEDSEAPPVSVEEIPEALEPPAPPARAKVSKAESTAASPSKAAKTLISEGSEGSDEPDRPSRDPLDRPSSARVSTGGAATPSRPSSPRGQKKVTEWTVEEHIEAGDEHFESDAIEPSLGEFKKALGKLGSAPSPTRAEIYVRIAEVNRRQKNPRLALTNFEKALAIVPDLSRAHAGVLACHVDQKNWKAVQTAEGKLLAALPVGDDARLEHLLEFADRAASNDAGDRAAAYLRQAHAEHPNDRRPIDALLPLLEAGGAADEARLLQRKLVEFIDDPGERAQAMHELAVSCMNDGDEEEALRLFEQVLDADPGFLEALEELATTLADNQEWAELERIYRKMVAAYADESDGPSRSILCEFHRKLALLYRDHLEDPEQALAALDEDLALRPDDAAGQLLAADLAIELENPARALVHLRRVTELEPMNPEPYRKLFDLGTRFGEPETTFLAASVLHAFGAATAKESGIHQHQGSQSVPAHQRPLRTEAWGWLRGRDHDLSIDRVMAALSPPVLRARVRSLEEKKKLPALPERHDPKTSTASVVRSIGWASQFLGVEAPAIYLDDKIDTPMSARFAKHQAMVIGKGAMRGRSMGELAFFAGRHLALCRPEYELVLHMHSIDELTACVLAGIKLTLGAGFGGPLASVVDALTAAVSTQLDDGERRSLDAAVRELTARSSSQVDLTSWVASVERCATRAGFTLCGDLELAIRLVEAEGDSAFSSARSRIADLCAFAVSGAYVKLRQELGSSLVGNGGLLRLSSPPPGR